MCILIYLEYRHYLGHSNTHNENLPLRRHFPGQKVPGWELLLKDWKILISMRRNLHFEFSFVIWNWFKSNDIFTYSNVIENYFSVILFVSKLLDQRIFRYIWRTIFLVDTFSLGAFWRVIVVARKIISKFCYFDSVLSNLTSI